MNEDELIEKIETMQQALTNATPTDPTEPIIITDPAIIKALQTMQDAFTNIGQS